MPEKDSSSKRLEEYNDVFADIANVLCFHGEEVVHENELENLASPGAQYRFETGEEDERGIREEERDVVKHWRAGDLLICVIGLENQTEADALMPLRVIAYDGASYKSEMVRIQEAQKREGCRIRPYPVVTLVLYFGLTHWKKPLRLYDCLAIPEGLKPFVSDYSINVVEVAWLDPEVVRKFRSDFRFVAEYFVQKRLHQSYAPSDQMIRHVDETLKLMSAITKDHRFEEMMNGRRAAQYRAGKEKEGVRMEWMLDEIEERGYKRGIAQGERMLDEIEERGYKRGIAQSERMLDEMRTTAKQDDIEKLAAYLRKTSPELSQEEAMKTAVSVLQ